MSRSRFSRQHYRIGSIDHGIGDIKDNAVAGTYQGAYLNGKIYGLASFTSVWGSEGMLAALLSFDE